MKALSPEVGEAVKVLGAFFARSADNGAPLGEGDAEILRELGELLLAWTAGPGRWVCEREAEDRKSMASLAVAFYYHHARIERTGPGDANALEEVRTLVDSTLSDGTIRKYAQRHRDLVLRMVERGETPVDIDPQIEAHLRARGNKELNAQLDLAALTRDLARNVSTEGAPAVSAYREYLRKKSARPEVE